MLSFCMSEVDLIAHKHAIESFTANLGIQVFMTSDGQPLQNPGYVSIFICNASKKKLRDVSFSFIFDPPIFIRKHAWDFGARREGFRCLSVDYNAICIKADYLDENQTFKCYFLLDHYTPGKFSLEATSPEDNIKILQVSSESRLSTRKSSLSRKLLRLNLLLSLLLLLVLVRNKHPEFFEINNPFQNFLHEEHK